MLGALLVTIGGGLGAVLRYGTNILAALLLGIRFPYGTLLVNSVGSFLAGSLMFLFVERFTGSDYWRLFFMVGFLGGYTTFSSFAWETWALYQDGQFLKACLNVIANNVFSLGMAFLGLYFGRWIGGD